MVMSFFCLTVKCWTEAWHEDLSGRGEPSCARPNWTGGVREIKYFEGKTNRNTVFVGEEYRRAGAVYLIEDRGCAVNVVVSFHAGRCRL